MTTNTKDAVIEQLVGALEDAGTLTTYDWRPSSIFKRYYASATGDYVDLRQFREKIDAALTAGREALAQPEQTQREAVSSVDKAWALFCSEIGEDKSPYPGMIQAFERHYGQSFKDKAWRNEASVWAQAWSAATRTTNPQASEPAPKGLFIDMIAEHGPEVVAEMASIGEPAPSKPKFVVVGDSITHEVDGEWVHEVTRYDDAGKVISKTSEPLAPSTAGERKPVFYWRPLKNGMYEGPVWADSVGGKMMRDEKPDEWMPLYGESTQPAQGEREELVSRILAVIPVFEKADQARYAPITALLQECAALLQSTHDARPVGELTDKQIAKIAQETQTAEPGRDGYILPYSFARAILAAARTQPAGELTDEQIRSIAEAVGEEMWPDSGDVGWTDEDTKFHRMFFVRALETARTQPERVPLPNHTEQANAAHAAAAKHTNEIVKLVNAARNGITGGEQ